MQEKNDFKNFFDSPLGWLLAGFFDQTGSV